MQPTGNRSKQKSSPKSISSFKNGLENLLKKSRVMDDIAENFIQLQHCYSYDAVYLLWHLIPHTKYWNFWVAWNSLKGKTKQKQIKTPFLYSKPQICTGFLLLITVILLTTGDLLLTYSTIWEMRVRLLVCDFFLNSNWKRIVPVGDSKINKPWCIHVEQIPWVSLESSLYRFSVECFLLIF